MMEREVLQGQCGCDVLQLASHVSLLAPFEQRPRRGFPNHSAVAW